MSVTTGPKKGLIIAAADGDAFGTYFRALLRALDTALFPYVIDHTLAAPPGSPANGAAYIVAASPTGAWSGHAGAITVWSTDNPAAPSGEWEFYAPEAGWVVFTKNGNQQLYWSGSAWTSAGGATTLTGLSDGPGSYSGAGGYALQVNAGATAFEFKAKPFDIGVFVAGVGINSQILLSLKVARACLFPAGASGSYAFATIAATGSTTFTFKKNGTSFATVVFAASGTTGTWTQASDATFAAGDILEIDGPATADATLANISFTLAGTRT